jgi:hypothetical protein
MPVGASDIDIYYVKANFYSPNPFSRKNIKISSQKIKKTLDKSQFIIYND